MNLLRHTAIIIILLPLSLHAQPYNKGVVIGKICDEQSKSPIEYTNIVLRAMPSDSMLTGTVTDRNGSFKIKDVPYGTYIIEYFFIGYEKKRTSPFMLSSQKNKVDLGMLNLVPSVTTMSEVSINAERSTMITKIDRKVFNVQKDIQAQTGSVNDVLQTIPSVSVDMDGNISLRGSGSVTILINGRPSLLTTSANLEQMPASLIEKVEVITNPSARYKPDGTAGIINIVLKKERKTGLNGILGANAGNNQRYNSNLQLNLNTGKVNLFGSYGYRKDYRWRGSELNSQSIDTSTHNSLTLLQTSDGSARMNSHLAQFGIDWALTENDIIGFSANLNLRTNERGDSTMNRYQDDHSIVSEQYQRIHTGSEEENSLGVKANYEHKFDKEGEHVLRFDADFERDAESEDDFYDNVYQIPAYLIATSRSLADNSEQSLNLAANYNRPIFEKSSLEAGYEGNVQITDQSQEVSDWDPTTLLWIMGTEGNKFYANQTVHALFSTVSSTWGKFSMMAGLRAEEALLNLEFRTISATTKSNYFSVYPSLHLALAQGQNEWQLNYSRRVNRPDGEDMNPVPEYRDPRNVFVGNPDLKPEDIHSIEFGYSIRKKNLSLVPTVFYRYKVNGFTMVTTSINDSVLMTTRANLATDQSAGIDLSGALQLDKICNFNFSTSGFYSQIDASNIGYTANKSTFTWSAKLNASFTITKTTMAQFNSQYRSKSLTPQGMREPSWVVNLGLRHDMWDKKLSFIATVSDLFDTQRMKSLVNTPVLVQESIRRRDGRVIYAGLVLNFGTNGKKVKEAKFEFDNGMDR